MTRVLYHSDAFASASRYGLARYSWELYRSLLELERPPQLIPFSSRAKLDAAERQALTEEYGFINVGWNHRALVLSWTLAGWPRVEHWCRQTDIVHTVEMDYPVATGKPWVVTVHDLGPLSHPQYFGESRPWLRSQGIQRAIERADLIVSVSHATASAVEELAGRSLGDRSRVLYEGVSEYFFIEPDMACLDTLTDLPEKGRPFFLWTGSLNPRKNLSTVLDAFERIAPHIDESLVLAGGLGWDSEELLERVERFGFSGRIHRPGYVSDEQLKALYRRSSGFIYVSLMEGFGLPILEAMACQCPVVTSNMSSMPEVAGNAGILVDPLDADAVAAAMQELSVSEERRSQLRTNGLARARSFAWNDVAVQMSSIYDELG